MKTSFNHFHPSASKHISNGKLKTLGQCFTDSQTARLLAALSKTSNMGSVLDPMAGQGSLLEAVAERVAKLKRSTTLVGVEIDQPTANIGKKHLSHICQQHKNIGGSLFCANAFHLHTWRDILPQTQFDLVISNPPYVRYQTQGKSSDQKPSKTEKIRDDLMSIARALSPGDECPIQYIST